MSRPQGVLAALGHQRYRGAGEAAEAKPAKRGPYEKREKAEVVR